MPPCDVMQTTSWHGQVTITYSNGPIQRKCGGQRPRSASCSETHASHLQQGDRRAPPKVRTKNEPDTFYGLFLST